MRFPAPSFTRRRSVRFGAAVTAAVVGAGAITFALTSAQAAVRLLGGRRRAVAILVSAEQPGLDASARPAIDAFLKALGSVDELADRMAGG